MKQKDIALIVVVSIVAAVFSLVLSNLVFDSAKNKNLQSDVVQAITPEFNQPDKKYFNSESIDPTQIIRIGDNPNTTPFNTKQP